MGSNAATKVAGRRARRIAAFATILPAVALAIAAVAHAAAPARSPRPQETQPASPSPQRPPRAEAGQTSPDGEGPSDRALAEVAEPLDPKQWGIGEQVEDLAFSDLEGRAGRLSDYADRHALVIVLRDVGCPVCRKYGLRTAALERDYARRNVAFLYVNPSSHDSDEECRAEAAEYGFTGRYVRDVEGRFGWHLKARTTTDVFVLDAERKLRYRGAIDDQIGRGVTRAEVKRRYLKEALDAVLAGERIAAPATTAPGCALPTFDPPPAGEATDAAATPTWHGRVEHIVQAKCQRCHRDGGPADFPLLELDDVAGREAMIRQVVTDRVMPPWFATKASGPFKDDLSLTDDERLDLLRWLQGGCPPGDPKDAPPPRTWQSGWQIGEPDLVIEIPEPVDIPATGVVDYLNVEAPTNLGQDVWIQAMQILCENPGICHHVLVHARYPSGQDFLDSYLPGKDATIYPEGMAALLEKGAVLWFNLHYTPNGKPVRERTKIGFKFAKSPPREIVSGKIVRIKDLYIEPHDPDYVAEATRRVRGNSRLRRLIPHMHLRGKSTTVELLFPDGTKKTPLELSRWHPDWQFAYELVEPIALPKGTEIRSICRYDNSANNPFVDHPELPVEEGNQIWQEMGGVFVEWVRPADAPREHRDPIDDQSLERRRSHARERLDKLDGRREGGGKQGDERERDGEAQRDG